MAFLLGACALLRPAVRRLPTLLAQRSAPAAKRSITFSQHALKPAGAAGVPYQRTRVPVGSRKGQLAYAQLLCWETAPVVLRRFASIHANELKKGSFISLDDSIYEVVGKQHVRSGKGGAFIQAEIRNLKGGSKITKRFRSRGEKIDEVVVDENSDYQVLEKSDTALTLMHTATFEQITIDRALVGNGLLTEGMVITVLSSQGQALQVKLPTFVEFTVKDTTAVNVSSTDTSYKPVQTEEGLEIQVPMFIGSGQVVKLRTETGEYVERVN